MPGLPPAPAKRVPGPTELCTECSRFLLSSASGWGEYYWVVHFIGLIPNKARNPGR